MTYKETFDLSKKHDIEVGKLLVAAEVDSVFGSDHEKYEEICSCVNDMYLDTNGITVCDLVNTLKDMIDNGDVDLDNVLDYGNDYNTVKEEACYADI